MSTDEFWDWAEKQLDARGLNWHRVEQLAGLSNATISRRARERLPPTETTCRAIARVFQIPLKQVYTRANKLPGPPPPDIPVDEISFLFGNLSKEDQERLLIIMRSLVAAQDTGK